VLQTPDTEFKKINVKLHFFYTSIVTKEETTNASSSSDTKNVGILEIRYLPFWIQFQVIRASRRRVRHLLLLLLLQPQMEETFV